MKKNILISQLVVAMGVMMFVGCDSTGATFKPNDELFEYTCYAKGSYWVYEDSATHGIDSISVITEPQKDKTNDEPSNGSDSWVKTFSNIYNYVNHNRFINDTFLYMPTIYGNFLSENDSRHGSGDLMPADCYYSPNVETMTMWKCPSFGICNLEGKSIRIFYPPNAKHCSNSNFFYFTIENKAYICDNYILNEKVSYEKEYFNITTRCSNGCDSIDRMPR